LIKLLLNSLYGKTIQKDILTKNHLWCKKTLESNFTELIKDFQKLSDDQYFVKEEVEETEFYSENIKEINNKVSTSLMPSNLGTFILSHSKRIMNNFILEIDGFKNPEIYYTDTDSIYINKNNWSILKKAGYVGEELLQGKNDYGSGGIIFGMFLAPKVKYCITLNDKFELEERMTFKGYQSTRVKVDDFIKLSEGEILKVNVKIPWTRSLEEGVIISKDDETMEKKFSASVNLLKRKLPDKYGRMFPYNGKDVDKKIIKKIKEENNFTNEELRNNLLDVDYSIV